MKQETPRWLLLLVAFATIASACIALVALVPAFGEWLDPRQPHSDLSTRDATEQSSVIVETSSAQGHTPTISQELEPTPTPTNDEAPAEPTIESTATTAPPPPILALKGHETIQEAGTIALVLAENEVAIGTADKFHDVLDQASPPFTVFLIRGPINEALTIWWGGWDIWENASQDHIATEIDKKIEEVKLGHPSDYETRGYRVVSCSGSLATCQIERAFP